MCEADSATRTGDRRLPLNLRRRAGDRCQGLAGLDLHARDTWNARGHRDGAAFIRGNAATSPLGRADIAIARQVFIHLSNQVILAILDNLRKHEIRWLLASTVPMGENVERLPAGQDYSIDGYAVDLAVDPFNLAYALPLHRGGAMRLFKL